MPYFCFFCFTLLVVAGSLLAVLSYISRPAARRSLLGILLRVAPAIAVLLMWLPLFFPNLTRERPTPSGMTGTYSTDDQRAPAATLELRADGSFSLVGFPALPADGEWSMVYDTSGGWALRLGNSGHFPLHRQQPPYEIDLYIGDPDSGPALFRRR